MLLGQIQSSRAQQQTFVAHCCSDATIALSIYFPNAERCGVTANRLDVENTKQQAELQPAAKNHVVEVGPLNLFESLCAAGTAD
jgi:hypothetical protein